MIHYSNWLAFILIIGLIALAMWWSLNNLQVSGYTNLPNKFPDPTNRMCRCHPMPFDGYDCGSHSLKKVCCDSFDLEGRNCYCCTSDSKGCHEIACEVPF